MKTLAILYPGCIEFEILLAREILKVQVSLSGLVTSIPFMMETILCELKPVE